MRRGGLLVLMLVFLGACGRGAQPPPATPAVAPVAPAAPPVAAVEVADVIPPDATAVARNQGHEHGLLDVVSEMIAPAPPCWWRLVGTVRAVYQVQLGIGVTYHVLDGALPEDEVEACGEAIRSLEMVTVDHGPVVEFIVRGGRFYAAWRGSLVVVGSHRDAIEAAAAAHAPAVAAAWRQRLATLGTGAIATWQRDALIGNLLGVPTVDYGLSMDFSNRDHPRMAGTLVARFATVADAAEAARRLRAGIPGSPIAPPPEVVTALLRLDVTVRDTAVEARFDEATFAGIDLAIMQAWVARLTAAPP